MQIHSRSVFRTQAARVGRHAIPSAWRDAVEPLPLE